MITPETHDHALTCEITQGRGCDCGLTGMAGVAFYVHGEAVLKKPVPKNAPADIPTEFDVKAYRYSAPPLPTAAEMHKKTMGAVTEFLKPRRSTCVDGIDLRKVDSTQLLEMLKSVQAEIERRSPVEPVRNCGVQWIKVKPDVASVEPPIYDCSGNEVFLEGLEE